MWFESALVVDPLFVELYFTNPLLSQQGEYVSLCSRKYTKAHLIF